MPGKIFLLLVILCGIWSQGITETFADESIRESSDILLRQKRVVNLIPSENRKLYIYRVPYIVMIKKNKRMTCVGSILSHRVVITISLCIIYEKTKYLVVSGAAHLHNHGADHSIIDIKRHHVNDRNRPMDGIALLTVDPPFEFGTFTNYILLHSEPLLAGTVGTIIGWGYNNNRTVTDYGFPKNQSLRSIQVPIMAHKDCVNIYRPYNIEISDKEVCTYHPEKYCGHTDGGAPLIVDGFLAGVHLWTGPSRRTCHPKYPDVFAILQHFEFIQWIKSNI